MFELSSVKVFHPADMPESEAREYARAEIADWYASRRKLDRIVIEIDGDEVTVQAFELSPIRRVRRITGYLSTIDSFNDSKRAELEARVAHEY